MDSVPTWDVLPTKSNTFYFINIVELSFQRYFYYSKLDPQYSCMWQQAATIIRLLLDVSMLRLINGLSKTLLFINNYIVQGTLQYLSFGPCSFQHHHH